VGATFTTGGNNTRQRDVNATGALLLGSGITSRNTEWYFGPEVTFSHSEPNNNQYSVGGVVGVGFFPWNGISLGAEYGLSVARDEVSDVTTWSFGKTTGSIILSVWL